MRVSRMKDESKVKKTKNKRSNFPSHSETTTRLTPIRPVALAENQVHIPQITRHCLGFIEPSSSDRAARMESQEMKWPARGLTWSLRHHAATRP